MSLSVQQNVNVDICIICREEPKNPRAIKPCLHVFCLECIQVWGEQLANPTCPSCRKPFSATQLFGVMVPLRKKIKGLAEDIILLNVEIVICMLVLWLLLGRDFMQDDKIFFSLCGTYIFTHRILFKIIKDRCF